MRVTKMTLNRRLRRVLGRRVVLEAAGYCDEEGRLQAVCGQMIRVSGQLFVQRNLDQIIIPRGCARRPGCRVTVRTAHDRTVRGRLVQIGRDFVELTQHLGRCRHLTLIPLGQVISIEQD
ncbi:MAG: hypothetical protein ACOX2K_03530 [Bacillota bacterium]